MCFIPIHCSNWIHKLIRNWHLFQKLPATGSCDAQETICLNQITRSALISFPVLFASTQKSFVPENQVVPASSLSGDSLMTATWMRPTGMNQIYEWNRKLTFTFNWCSLRLSAEGRKKQQTNRKQQKNNYRLITYWHWWQREKLTIAIEWRNNNERDENNNLLIKWQKYL